MIYLIFAVNLVLTLLIEGAVIFLMVRRMDAVRASALCNLLTNPALNLLLAVFVRAFGTAAYYPALFALEACAVLLEAWLLSLLCGFAQKRALFLSFIMNAASYFSGAALYYLIGT